MSMHMIWPAWIASIALSFVGFETYALTTGKATLSRFVWELTAAWPPLPFVVGFLMGFLVCHFWWGGSVSFAPIGKVFGHLVGH